jgi:hypothetical protein
MIKSLEDVQKLNQSNVDNAMKLFGDWTKGWQAIATEWQDYSKRSYAESTQTFEKMVAAKTVEQAMEIQSGFAKRAYQDYVREVNKVGAMYTDFAKEAYKPVEKAIKHGR